MKTPATGITLTTDGKIRGHAIRLRSHGVRTSVDFRERVRPQAVDKTLSEKIDLRALVGHDPNRVLGRISSGTLVVTKDARGLLAEIDPPDTTYADDLIASIRRRDMRGWSFYRSRR